MINKMFFFYLHTYIYINLHIVRVLNINFCNKKCVWVYCVANVEDVFGFKYNKCILFWMWTNICVSLLKLSVDVVSEITKTTTNSLLSLYVPSLQLWSKTGRFSSLIENKAICEKQLNKDSPKYLVFGMPAEDAL